MRSRSMLVGLGVAMAAGGASAALLVAPDVSSAATATSRITMTYPVGTSMQTVTVSSFVFSATAAVDSSTGAPSGKVDMQPISVNRSTDAHSADIVGDLMAGRGLSTVVLVRYKPDASGKLVPAVQYTLTQVIVTKYQLKAGPGGTTADQFQLTARSVGTKYR